ncbi:MAG: glutamyl-tRNA reductase, partial [Solirubrobacteraceae bacterium]
EAEIQGQVKRAYEAALDSDTVGPLTSRLFRAALQTGKRVRTETSIGAGQLSLPGAAVALARDCLSALEGREVVIIGTGETSELTARALADSGARPVFVANRRRDRAIALARRYGGCSVALDELPEALIRADIVVAATASPHLLLEESEVADVMVERGGRPLLLIDLAVPRDIDAACGSLGGVSLYDIDDLQAVADRSRKIRQGEAKRAEGILEEEIGRFAGWLGSLEVLPTLSALREHATTIADGVLAENRGRWESASARDLERVDALARAIVNRLLHEPTVQMKAMHDDRAHARMAVIRDLFGLSVEEGLSDGADADRTPIQSAPAAEVRELPSRPRAARHG